MAVAFDDFVTARPAAATVNGADLLALIQGSATVKLAVSDLISDMGIVTDTDTDAAATASKVALRDASANFASNSIQLNETAVTTAAGTTTLTTASAHYIRFTGSTTQNCDLPTGTSATVGWRRLIINDSTGIVTVRNSAGTTQCLLVAGTRAWLECTATGTPGTWKFDRAIVNAAQGITIKPTSGGSANPVLNINQGVSSAFDPWIVWDDTASVQGLKFGHRNGAGTVTLNGQAQDNGTWYFTTIGTIGGLNIFDFGMRRGGAGGIYAQGFGGSATHEFSSGGDASNPYFVRFTTLTAGVQVGVFKGAASRTVPVLQLQNSAGASLGHVGGCIHNSFTDAGNVTATGETDLYSYTTVANTLAVNGDKLVATFGGIFANALTATVRLKVYFGGTLVFDSAAMTLAATTDWQVRVLGERVSSTVVRFTTSLTTSGATNANYSDYVEVTGLTLTGTNVFKITGESDGTGEANNDIVAKLGGVDLIPAA